MRWWQRVFLALWDIGDAIYLQVRWLFDRFEWPRRDEERDRRPKDEA